MFRRLALFALERGVAAADVDAPVRTLRPFDPLLRAAARKRVRRAITEAQRLTAVDDPAHALRLAFLTAAGERIVTECDDAGWVQQRYEARRRPVRPPPRGPWLLGSTAALAVLLAVAALVLAHVLRPFDPRDEPAGAVFADAVPRFVAANARDGPTSELEAARADATGPAARGALGDDVVGELGRVLGAASAVGAAGSDAEQRQAADRFIATTVDLDHALAARRLPYFVDAELLRRSGSAVPLLLSFYVQREGDAVAGDAHTRVLYLWRLDSLNLRQGLLGYTRPHTPAALVLLDQIESDLVLYVLPALPEGEPLTLVDEATEARREPWAARLMQRAAALVRRHYELSPPSDPTALLRVGRLLARRRALVREWQASLRGQRRVLRVPERLVPEADYSDDLSLRITRAQLREWDALHEELLEPELLAAFVEVRDRYARSVARHEVQHRLDYARGLIPLPEILARHLGENNVLGADPASLAARSRDELSAYLSSIAHCPDSPILDLVLVSRFLFDPSSLGGPYSYAALGVLEGIGIELGIDTARILGSGSISRERSAELFRAVADRPPDRLRAAALRAYSSLFGRELEQVDIRLRPPNPVWRH